VRELAQPPALIICVELEGPPRFTLACRSDSEELRLRNDVGANLEQILARTQVGLESFAGRAADPSPSAVTAAAATIVKGEMTVADVVTLAADGHTRACEWLTWAVRNLEKDDERRDAILLYLEHRAPELLIEIAARLQASGGSGP
jgi:hypothetical protein